MLPLFLALLAGAAAQETSFSSLASGTPITVSTSQFYTLPSSIQFTSIPSLTSRPVTTSTYQGPFSNFSSSSRTISPSSLLSPSGSAVPMPTPTDNLEPAILGLIPSFNGTNMTGIGSWYRTNQSSDDTNGQSWCRLYYDDTWMGFAVNVTAMLDDFGDVYTEAAKGYCGLQANMTNPENGNFIQAYLIDGFAEEWVLSPFSVDLTVAAFTALYGNETDNKNDVIRNLTWTFTGLRATNYTFEADTRSNTSLPAEIVGKTDPLISSNGHALGFSGWFSLAASLAGILFF